MPTERATARRPKGFEPDSNSPSRFFSHCASLTVLLYLLHSKFNETHLLAPFAGLITSEMLATVRRVLPNPNPYAYTIEQFVASNFPFEAYTLPEILLTIQD